MGISVYQDDCDFKGCSRDAYPTDNILREQHPKRRFCTPSPEPAIKGSRQRQLRLALSSSGLGQLKHQQCSFTSLHTEETVQPLHWLSTAISCTSPPLRPGLSLSHLHHASLSLFNMHGSITQAFLEAVLWSPFAVRGLEASSPSWESLMLLWPFYTA